MITLTREEAQQALDALTKAYEDSCNYQDINGDQVFAAIETLRARLAQGEKEQAPDHENSEQYRMQMTAISTAAIGYWKEGDDIHPAYDTVALRDVAKLYAKYDALYKKHKQQEPVAWMDPTEFGAKDAFNWRKNEIYTELLYTAPPQREWVGLTDEEIKGVLETTHPENRWTIAERIEANLKEKNSV
jgi:hypothetical protein